MADPLYPSVQGQGVPDLGLAQYSVSTPMTAIYTNSDSTGPDMCEPPPLTGDVANMGIDPGVPYFDLQLANAQPVMSPGELSAPQGIGQVTTPTFITPDMCVPDLQAGDLTGPGIDQVNEFAPDPQTGDLLQFAQPGGLDIHAASGQSMPVDPFAPDLAEYDRPDGLDMPGPMSVDPSVPDLQQPDLEQEIHMSDRPGDLAADALDVLHADPTDKAIPSDSTNELWMQQDGDNQRRERHMGMLDHGLETVK